MIHQSAEVSPPENNFVVVLEYFSGGFKKVNNICLIRLVLVGTRTSKLIWLSLQWNNKVLSTGLSYLHLNSYIHR